MSERADVVVVGAGVVGLAIARAVAAAGREVVVLEAEHAVGAGVTARSSEVIHAGLYYPPGSWKARLCVAGRESLYRYVEKHDIGYRRIGKLIVATQEAEAPLLEAIRARAHACGAGELRLLDGAEAKRLEPELRCAAALLSPATGIVDSHGLVRALRADVEALGGAVVLGARVAGGHVDDEGIEVEIVAGATVADATVVGATIDRLRCAALVNAAGLGAIDLARRIGGVPSHLIPSLYPVKGSYFALAGRAPFQRLIYPVPEVPEPGGLGVHLTLDLGGQARFGPDVEPVERIDYDVDPRRAAAFAAAVRRFWPALPDGALRPAFAGIRPRITPPGAPLADFAILGAPAHGVPGLVHLLGIESPGLTSALAIGDEVASMVAR